MWLKRRATTRSSTSPIEVCGVDFRNPILLAAGTAGFGREVAGVVAIDRLGGLITKAVSPKPRAGNAPPRVAEFGGGMLNSVGLANPGLEAVKEKFLPWLSSHVPNLPVLVNVVGDVVADYVKVIEELGGQAAVSGFELNVSCPNSGRGGEEFGADAAVLGELVSRTREVTDKPLFVKLAPTLPDLANSALVAEEAGASGFSLVNTIPGFLFRDGGAPRLGRGRGGISGPALLAVGVLATKTVRECSRLPIIGVGGIRHPEDVRQYIEAGASLVAIGTAALADPRVPERLADYWERHG